MKEYVAQTGGRYTYADDVLNLQELAVSMTSLFSDCSNFIISGCEPSEGSITPGYVWINGKVRRFEGAVNTTFPYYLYEKNTFDSVTYANEVNKRGRCNYLCFGDTSVPQQPDSVTGALPGFIEMGSDYSPRLIDKFFGRYALLLDSPFSRQTVKKELTFTGKLTVEKDVESKTAVSVASADGERLLKNTIKLSGDASIGAYYQGVLVNEIIITTDGTFRLYSQGNELARIDRDGIVIGSLKAQSATVGSVDISGEDIANSGHATDKGALHINRTGYQGGNTKFRSLHVYNGKSSAPMFSVDGPTNAVSVSAAFSIINDGNGFALQNRLFQKNATALVNTMNWSDRDGEKIAVVGFDSAETFDFLVRNNLGNIVINPNGYLNVQSEMRVNGINIADTYVTNTVFTTELNKKVDAVSGKGLSTEDFTTLYKEKLDSIMTGSIGSGGDGFVTAENVGQELAKKMNKADNLSDLDNKASARVNLDVYSRGETNALYFKISGLLSEVTALSNSEIDGKTPEQIIQLKEQKQQSVRDNIDAERKGTGETKLAKASNLSDLQDKTAARQNLGVYSIAYIDQIMGGKLDRNEAYEGEIFTTSHRTKLEDIKTGIFAGTVINGVSQSQVEGYVTTSSVRTELEKKANRLLDGYSASDKNTIAANIAVYSKTEGDARYGKLSSSLQDYITHLTGTGMSTVNAQKTLRDRIDAPAKADLNVFLQKDKRLADLNITNDTQRKQICTTLGAAYAPDYQTKLNDTGWIACTGSNAGTLFARQIGNIVCIQGTINTARRTGNTWGSCAVIPNQISPPRYGCRQTAADFNDDHKYNRGCSFRIQAGSRNILIHERGMYNVQTELHFSYMV